MLSRVALGLVVEVTYAVLTRAWLARWDDPVAGEPAITAARIATIPIHWLLFCGVVRSRPRRRAPIGHPFFVLGVLLLLLAAVVPDGRFPAWSWTFTLVFLLGSVVIGVREELVYRGALQTLLERRMGWIGAAVVSNVLFVAYHYRAFDFTPTRVATIFLVGAALGIVYARTGSLRVPIAIHVAYDCVLVARALVPSAVPGFVATLLQLAALALLAVWVTRTPPSPR